jgi:hypothetical protein
MGNKVESKVPENLKHRKMKMFLFIFSILVIAIIPISNCIRNNNDPENKVKHSIRYYLNEHLNDASSYEPLEWSHIIKNGDKYIIRHKFRAKNGFGAIMLNDKIFSVSTDNYNVLDVN